MRKYARIVTELPGPKTRALLELKDNCVARAFSIYVPAVIDRGEGAVFRDIDGNQFLDLGGGVGVLNVGHSASEVVEAVKNQIERFSHTDFSVIPYESFIHLADRLTRLAPGPTPKKAAFFNSGAEAVENSIKIARVYTRRKAIICFEGAFHGRTWMAMTLTSKVKPYKDGYSPFAPEVYRVPAPYCYRCAFHLKYPECGLACAEAVERAFVTMVNPDDTAAVIIEPVLGEGGFIVPPVDYMKRLREICDRYGIVLITDEVQTGFARTGKMFAMEHFGVEPDLMPVAKSIAGGMVLSGVIGKAKMMDAPADSTIGGTYPGNPVSCAAGLAVLDIMEKKNLPGRAVELGRIIRRRFESMQDRYSLIGDVRGLGAMMAVELVKDRNTKEPASKETSAILNKCLHKGAVFLKAGTLGNVIRLLMPLVITDDQLEEAIDILEESIGEAAAEK